MKRLRPLIAATVTAACVTGALLAQGGGYEIQVYPSELMTPGDTMVELHSNFTAQGFKTPIEGVLPDNHAEHETVEITHGWNEWFETGLYEFTSVQPDGGWMWVGTHIRPRLAIPEKYHLPVGLSLSAEFGYQRPNFATDTWTIEIRPIVDKKMGKLYWSFNPTFDKSFHGPEQDTGYIFSPNVKISYDVFKRAAFGVEYYGVVGPFRNLYTTSDQFHQIFPTVDIDFGPNWEFNFGVGMGVTQATEHVTVKAIVGYRFRRNKREP